MFGGRFTEVNRQQRYNLGRLNPDGSLDPDWTSSSDDVVSSLAADADGFVYAAGSFQHINGIASAYLAKISATGVPQVPPQRHSFGPVSTSTLVLALENRGSIYVGGDHLYASGAFGNDPVRISTEDGGGVDASWQPAITVGS